MPYRMQSPVRLNLSRLLPDMARVWPCNGHGQSGNGHAGTVLAMPVLYMPVLGMPVLGMPVQWLALPLPVQWLALPLPVQGLPTLPIPGTYPTHTRYHHTHTPVPIPPCTIPTSTGHVPHAGQLTTRARVKSPVLAKSTCTVATIHGTVLYFGHCRHG